MRRPASIRNHYVMFVCDIYLTIRVSGYVANMMRLSTEVRLPVLVVIRTVSSRSKFAQSVHTNITFRVIIIRRHCDRGILSFANVVGGKMLDTGGCCVAAWESEADADVIA